MKIKTKIFIVVSLAIIVAIVTVCVIFSKPAVKRYDYTDCTVECKVSSGTEIFSAELSEEQRDNLINIIKNSELKKTDNQVPVAVGGSTEYLIRLKNGDEICIVPHLDYLIVSDKNAKISMTEYDSHDSTELIVSNAMAYKCNSEALSALNAINTEISD